MTGVANCKLKGEKLVYNNYSRGIEGGFNRQRLESRGRLEDDRTQRTTTQVLNMIQKVQTDRYSPDESGRRAVDGHEKE